MNQLPSQQNKKALDQLSKDFPPTDVKYTLALDKDFSLEAAEEAAVGAITRLKQFVENGHSCEGLDFQYSKIIQF